MANGIEGFLSQKIGPVPYWMVGLGVAGVVGIVVYRRQSTAGGQAGPQGTGSSINPFAPSPIIVTPNTMPGGTSSANVPPPPPPPGGCPPDTPFKMSDWTNFRGSWQYMPSGVDAPYTKNCATYSHITDENVVAQILQGGGKVYFFATPGNPVEGNYGAVYQKSAATSGQGGGGQRSSAVRMLPGGGRVTRFLTPHAHPQYVHTGMGGSSGGEFGPWGYGVPPSNQPRGSERTPGAAFQGPGYGGGAPQPSRGIRAVARRTGIPSIRLMALNPGHWRPGSGRRSDTVFIH